MWATPPDPDILTGAVAKLVVVVQVPLASVERVVYARAPGDVGVYSSSTLVTLGLGARGAWRGAPALAGLRLAAEMGRLLTDRQC